MRAKPAAQLAVGATLAIKRSKTSVSKAQRRVQEHVQIDERETARRARLDQAQWQPAHAAKSRSLTRKSPARKSSSRKKSR